jgi:hypothetical protein
VTDRIADERNRLAAVHAVARVTLALVFLWHGLVPKLLAHHADEVALLRDGGLSPAAADRGVTLLGLAEVALAVVLLATWRIRAIFLLVAAAMVAVTIGIGLHSPRFIPAAFTPVTLNLCVAALAVIGWYAGEPRRR